MRLKSWMPEISAGGKPLVLAGRELPADVGGRSRGPIRILCIGPGEWLLASHQHHAVVIDEHFGGELDRHGLVLADLSDALAGFEVAGPAARDVLGKGCGLDMHPFAFPVERCARTRLANVPVVIESREEEGRFELFVSRSLAQYLHGWLLDAAVEFQAA